MNLLERVFFIQSFTRENKKQRVLLLHHRCTPKARNIFVKKGIM